jgi:hypothetical protein
LAETDPKLGDQLVDILTPIKAVDEKIARLGGAGGAGIAKELRLPGSGGSREWPPPRPFDPAWFTPFRSIAATRSTGEKSKKKPPCSSDLRPLISAQVGFVHVVSLTVPFRLIGQPEPDCRHVE